MTQMDVGSVPKTLKLKLSNGTEVTLREFTALDVVDWENSPHKTNSPDGEQKFEGNMFMIWLSARTRTADGSFTPTFHEFLDSWPASDLTNTDLIEKSVRFINIPFGGSDKGT